jgi:hypothetical protein
VTPISWSGDIADWKDVARRCGIGIETDQADVVVMAGSVLSWQSVQ